MHYYPHHIGDFIKDTANLDDHQLATYLRLIWAYYTEEKPFDDDCEGIAFAMRSDEKTVRLLLKHYFSLEDGMWFHSRCEREIEIFKGKSEKARNSANARWKNANAMRTHSDGNANEPVSDANQEPRTKNQEKIKNTRPAKAELDAAFEVFWKAYPKKVSKKDAAKAWGKIKPDKHQSIMRGLFNHMSCEQWVKDNGQYIPNAATWLNKERWEDEIRPYGQRTETSRDNSAVGRVKARAAERERARQGAQPEYFGGRDFIEGDFTAGRPGDGAPLDPYDGDLWPQMGEPVR